MIAQIKDLTIDFKDVSYIRLVSSEDKSYVRFVLNSGNEEVVIFENRTLAEKAYTTASGFFQFFGR